METPGLQHIQALIDADQPVSLVFQYADDEILLQINTLCVNFLARVDKLFLLESMVMIIREMIMNAQKANAKRIHFRKRNIDMADHESYLQGMETFKKQVLGIPGKLQKTLLDTEFTTTLTIRKNGKMLEMSVSNPAPITREEKERITFRIDKALANNNLMEVYDEILDQSEGAGFGITFILLTLKKIGIDPHTFTLASDGKNTVAKFTLPSDLKPNDITTGIKMKIILDLEGLPTFPETIFELQKMCTSPETSIEAISKKIMTDPALSSEVIKIANSAGFITVKNVTSIREAILIIGLKNLNELLIACKSRNILDKRFAKYEEIWEHSLKTAFYARRIAQSYYDERTAEMSYMSGLLHDIGKIVLMSIDMDLVTIIASEVQDRNMLSSTILEEISIGISHSEIGELIAIKWNFPPYMVETIRNHHAPINTGIQYPKVINATYLANMLCGIETGIFTYACIYETIMEQFKFDSISRLEAFHMQVKSTYKSR